MITDRVERTPNFQFASLIDQHSMYLLRATHFCQHPYSDHATGQMKDLTVHCNVAGSRYLLKDFPHSSPTTRPRDMFDEGGCPPSITHMLYVAQGHGSPPLQTQTYDRPALYLFGEPSPATGSESSAVAPAGAGGGAFRCTTSDDCELLGSCVAGACHCRPGFEGPSCGTLSLAPIASSAGSSAAAVWPQAAPLQRNGSFSWGFTVVHDEQAGLYHAAVNVGCCSLPKATDPPSSCSVTVGEFITPCSRFGFTPARLAKKRLEAAFPCH